MQHEWQNKLIDRLRTKYVDRQAHAIIQPLCDSTDDISEPHWHVTFVWAQAPYIGCESISVVCDPGTRPEDFRFEGDDAIDKLIDGAFSIFNARMEAMKVVQDAMQETEGIMSRNLDRATRPEAALDERPSNVTPLKRHLH